MNKRIIGIALLTLSSVALAENTPYPDSEIKAVADDMVIHYDRAVVLGTNDQEYIADQKKRLFDALKKDLSVEKCKDNRAIDLYQCASMFICYESPSKHNLHPDLLCIF